MGVLDDLAQARADYERGDWAAALDTWSGVGPGRPGRRRPARRRHGRRTCWVAATRRSSATSGPSGCARTRGDLGGAVALRLPPGDDPRAPAASRRMAAGWTARAERMLDELGADAVERGLRRVPAACTAHLGAGDLRGRPPRRRRRRPPTSGRRHGDPDLLALGLCAVGPDRDLLRAAWPRGSRCSTRRWSRSTAGEVSPEVFGNVYCIAIEGCQEIADFDRVAEWTSALHRWCASQPGLVAFTGQCSIHRGQVMRQRGAWAEALEEFERAAERYRLANALDADRPGRGRARRRAPAAR